MSGSQRLRLRLNELLAAAADEIFALVVEALAEYEDEAARCRSEVTRSRSEVTRSRSEVTRSRSEVTRSRSEVTGLRQQLQQLTVLKPHVVLLRADIQSVSEEEEETPTFDLHQVKQEQLDQHISPDVDDVRRPKTELLPLLPPSEGSSWSQEGDLRLVPDSPDASFEELPASQPHTDIEASPPFVTPNEGEWSSGSSASDPVHAGFPVQEPSQKVCDFCGKRFRRDSALVRHVDKIHRGLKAFPCSQCDKTFASRGHLVAHLRIHSGEKPFHCSYCSRAFAQSSNLYVHLRLHTGEKPYFCRACGKSVSRTNHLKTCRMNRVRMKTLRCSVCEKTFQTASELHVHQQSHQTADLQSLTTTESERPG